MNYDNLTKENFIKHVEILENYIYFLVKLERELKGEKTQFQDFLEFRNEAQNIIESDLIQIFDTKDILEKKESNKQEILKVYNKINDRFYKLISFSEANDIFFRMCTLKTYVNTFENRLDKFIQENIVLDKKDFLLKEIDNVLNPHHFTENRNFFNEVSKRILINSREKKVEFLKNKLLELNIVVKVFEIDYKRPKPKHIQSFDINETPQLTKPTKPNKSLLFEGKDLNLSERYKIANKVLDIDKKIRTLNIGELEKYQLLAYILGCNKDNARNIMNGSYNSKDRDLSNYFNDLGLNE